MKHGLKTNWNCILALLIFLAAFSAIGAETNNWKLVWHDEFETNGPPNPANWNYERGFVRNHEAQWYQSENAFCTNGLLVIEARREHKPNPNFATNSTDWRTSREWIDYTSASITSRKLQEFKYGKFEMRARIDTRLGSWPAFWTLGATPDIRWPAGGEVDVMEFYRDMVVARFYFCRDRLFSARMFRTIRTAEYFELVGLFLHPMDGDEHLVRAAGSDSWMRMDWARSSPSPSPPRRWPPSFRR
jgi:beta-glucanase (GH16 family)